MLTYAITPNPFPNTQKAHTMNELLTRELTNDELSLVSGGGTTAQASFGLREIYGYRARQIDRMERLDNTGDAGGDDWNEIEHTYQS
jgi:hypothetical protein